VPEEVRREVLDHLYELLNIANHDKRLKTYYPLLLDNDHGHLAETWHGVPDLIEAGVISVEDAAARKEGFLKLLKSDYENVKRLTRVVDVPGLIRAGLISKDDLASSRP